MRQTGLVPSNWIWHLCAIFVLLISSSGHAATLDRIYRKHSHYDGHWWKTADEDERNGFESGVCEYLSGVQTPHHGWDVNYISYQKYLSRFYQEPSHISVGYLNVIMEFRRGRINFLGYDDAEKRSAVWWNDERRAARIAFIEGYTHASALFRPNVKWTKDIDFYMLFIQKNNDRVESDYKLKGMRSQLDYGSLSAELEYLADPPRRAVKRGYAPPLAKTGTSTPALDPHSSAPSPGSMVPEDPPADQRSYDGRWWIGSQFEDKQAFLKGVNEFIVTKFPDRIHIIYDFEEIQNYFDNYFLESRNISQSLLPLYLKYAEMRRIPVESNYQMALRHSGEIWMGFSESERIAFFEAYKLASNYFRPQVKWTKDQGSYLAALDEQARRVERDFNMYGVGSKLEYGSLADEIDALADPVAIRPQKSR